MLIFPTKITLEELFFINLIVDFRISFFNLPNPSNENLFPDLLILSACYTFAWTGASLSGGCFLGQLAHGGECKG